MRVAFRDSGFRLRLQFEVQVAGGDCCGDGFPVRPCNSGSLSSGNSNAQSKDQQNFRNS